MFLKFSKFYTFLSLILKFNISLYGVIFSFLAVFSFYLFNDSAAAESAGLEKRSLAPETAIFMNAAEKNIIDSNFLILSAGRHVKKILDSAAALQKYIPARDLLFYSQIVHTGRPRVISTGGRVYACEIPLISSDYSARFIYLDPSGGLLFPPASDSTGARYFLTAREWREIVSTDYLLPQNRFFASGIPGVLESFPFYSNERHQGLVELCGIPVESEAMKDFKIIDYINEMPSKSIAKKKLTVLSRAGNESIDFFPLKSFSYACAYCADWWHIASSCSDEVIFERYYDYLSGKPAFGVNPRALEMIYLKRSAVDSAFFTVSGYLKDPVFLDEKVHSSLEGYASALVLPDVKSAPDAGDKNVVYTVDENNRFYMGDEYIELFRSQGDNADILTAALDIHGIVLAGIPFYMKSVPLAHSVKAVAVIGYKKNDGVTLFIYKDFEDPAKIFRIAPAGIFSEAYCFSHEFRAKARYTVKNRKLTIETFDQRGNKINVDSISATFPVEDRRVKFLKEARGFYFHQVKKEDFTGISRAVLVAEIKKKYFVSGDKELYTLKYGVY